MPDLMFGHVAEESTVRTALLQTGTCNLSTLPEDFLEAGSGSEESSA
ncbi:hypothetical protein [Streptomyces abikoensis]